MAVRVASGRSGRLCHMQCPNCGGFRTEKVEGVQLVGFVLAGLVLWIVGLFITMPLYWILKSQETGDERIEYGYECELCDHEWLQRPGESKNIRVRPDLIRRGEQRLRKQEEEDDDDWWWS